MLNVRLSDRPAEAGNLVPAPGVLVLAVLPATASTTPSEPAEPAGVTSGGATSQGAMLAPLSAPMDDDLRVEIEAFLQDSAHTGRAGQVATLPRPMRTPRRVLLVGVGAQDEAGWRSAGAALARAAKAADDLVIAMPDSVGEAGVRGIAEGLWLASYQFRMTKPRTPPVMDARAHHPGAVIDAPTDEGPQRVTLLVADADTLADTLEDAHTVAMSTRFARDLTNMPSEDKTPEWFAGQIQAIAAGNANLTVRVLAGDELVDGRLRRNRRGRQRLHSGSAPGRTLLAAARRHVSCRAGR